MKETIDIVSTFDLDPESDTFQQQVDIIKKILYRVIGGETTMSAADFLSQSFLKNNEADFLPQDFAVQLSLLLIQYPKKTVLDPFTQPSNL
jgi:hypothetical protein